MNSPLGLPLSRRFLVRAYIAAAVFAAVPFGLGFLTGWAIFR